MHDKTLLMALYKRLTDGAIDLDKFNQLVARVVVETLGGSRASIWFFQGTLRDCLLCQSMYDRASSQWSAGATMHEDDCSEYFRALLDIKLIAAGDAHLDGRTACLDRLELTPAVSYAVMDVLIEVNGAAVGMVRCERDGESSWSADDEVFLKQVGAMIGLVLQKRG